jgi:hypothetical protein
MGITFKHRIWKPIMDLVAEVKGPGYGKYRTTSIRLLLTAAKRIGWVGNLTHFDAMLSEAADEIISEGRWSDNKQHAMQYLFYSFVAQKAREKALEYVRPRQTQRPDIKWRDVA